MHSDGALPARRERLEMEARWCAQSEAAESAAASDGFLTAAEYRSAKSGAAIIRNAETPNTSTKILAGQWPFLSNTRSYDPQHRAMLVLCISLRSHAIL